MSNQKHKYHVPLLPAVTAQSGVYVHTTETGSEWSYAYDIQAAGTKSERRIGKLQVDGLERLIATARPGDSMQTPWGLMARVSDTPYERGFLLEHTHGQPLDPSQGTLLEVPEGLLMRGGRWTAQVGPWRYALSGMAMETRSERRIGRLYFGPTGLSGAKQGDYIDTPWGRLRWMGPVSLVNITDYEQGFLLRGTRDRSLDGFEGDVIFPNIGSVAVRLESLYLDSGFQVAKDARPAHSVSLLLAGRPERDVEIQGTLFLDPNECTLNDFGDLQGCTRMAIRGIEVSLSRLRLADPKNLKRKIFEVTGDELPQPFKLVVQGQLERCYLTVDRQLVPLFLDDGV